MRREIMVVLVGVALGMAGSATAAAQESPQGGTAAATTGDGQNQTLDPNLPGVGEGEQGFAYSAHALLQPLVDMSRLGAEKASDPEIVDLSEQMADDYADLANELEQAAKAAGIDASKGEAPHGENRLDRLQISGDGFDLAYLIEQEGLHDKLIAIYTMAASGAKKDALAKHAEHGQDVLTRNYDEIAQLQERFAEARSSR